MYFPGGSVVKIPLANAGDAGDLFWSLGQKAPLEKEMVTHSSTFTWRIPWIGEPGGLHTAHWVAKCWTHSSP